MNARPKFGNRTWRQLKNLLAVPAGVLLLCLLAPNGLTQTFTDLHSFTATSGSAGASGTNSDGVNPYWGLLLSGNTLYGAAQVGGSSGWGTVFAVNTDGTGFTNLHNFTATSGPNPGTNSDGVNPLGVLILSGNTLYGTANVGGNSGRGSLFAVNIDGTSFTTLHSFTAASGSAGGYGTNSDGTYPRTGLILTGNTLHGTAPGGGSSGWGTVFSLALPRSQLSITALGTNVILTWPTNAAGFTLEFATDLVSPTVWNTNSTAPVVINGQNTVTNPIIGSQMFFRLSQ